MNRRTQQSPTLFPNGSNLNLFYSLLVRNHSKSRRPMLIWTRKWSISRGCPRPATHTTTWTTTTHRSTRLSGASVPGACATPSAWEATNSEKCSAATRATKRPWSTIGIAPRRNPRSRPTAPTSGVLSGTLANGVRYVGHEMMLGIDFRGLSRSVRQHIKKTGNHYYVDVKNNVDYCSKHFPVRTENGFRCRTVVKNSNFKKLHRLHIFLIQMYFYIVDRTFRVASFLDTFVSKCSRLAETATNQTMQTDYSYFSVIYCTQMNEIIHNHYGRDDTRQRILCIQHSISRKRHPHEKKTTIMQRFLSSFCGKYSVFS